jgi:L-ascorbate metabolism protein UlaG (beta-lactamase superfamily)
VIRGAKSGSATKESEVADDNLRRRLWVGGAGATVLGGTAALLYRAAPAFWQQYFREMGEDVAPAAAKPNWREWPATGVHAAWLGHSTVLLKMDGLHILTDPVFSLRCGLSLGPVTLGLKRLTAPALRIEDLPPIDLVLLSHAHMDHFDIPSLRDLEGKKTRVITAKSTSDLLRVSRYAGVTELNWGETAQVGPIQVRALEVNHWGARMRTDTYRGYNGYVLESASSRVLFAGDTAMTDAFRAARSSREIDLAIMPIGAYNPWIRYHCTPEQAVRMADHAGAARLLPVHHQTFRLSREPFLEPIERFIAAAGDRTALRAIGESVTLA